MGDDMVENSKRL